MGLGLLLIPSLAGYWFLQRANFWRFDNYRLSGYHLLFRSALAGIFLTVAAHTIAVLLNIHAPQLRSFLYSHVPLDYVDTAMLTILLAGATPPVINKLHSEEKAADRTARNYGDLIEMVIASAFRRNRMIELSLKNRKSYVGLVLWSSITKRGRSDVTLLPIASGYRSEDTLELHLTTNYAPLIKKLIDKDAEGIDDLLRDYSVVLPRSEVCSARLFDPAVYRRFQQSRRGSQDA